MKYPKTIFVQVENESSNDEYLNAQEDSSDDSFNDGKIAVYELKEMKTRKTTTELN